MRTEGLNAISRKMETVFQERCYLNVDSPCNHRFSVDHLKSKCIYSVKKEEKIFTHFTGFNSYSDFKNVLEFVLPDLDRKRLVYWGTSQAKASFVDIEKLFNTSDEEKFSFRYRYRH